MPRGGPDFQLCVAASPYLQQHVVAAVVKLDAPHGLLVAAVEAFGEPEHRSQRPDGAAAAPAEFPEQLVPFLGHGPPVVARDQRNRVDFVGVEPAQIAVPDEIARVPMVALVADMHADVVQQRGVFEPFALAVRQAVNGAGLIEQRQRETGDLVRVFGPVIAPFGEFDHAAAAHVGIASRVRDFPAMPRDVIEHEPFAERQVRERHRRCAEATDDRIEQDGAGDREVGAPGLEAGYPQPLFEIQIEQVLSQAVDLLRGDTPVPQRRVGRAAFGRGDRGADAQDRT